MDKPTWDDLVPAQVIGMAQRSGEQDQDPRPTVIGIGTVYVMPGIVTPCGLEGPSGLGQNCYLDLLQTKPGFDFVQLG